MSASVTSDDSALSSLPSEPSLDSFDAASVEDCTASPVKKANADFVAAVKAPPAKKAKTNVTIRQMVTSEKLSVRMASHTNHYATWSSGRKKSGRQILPAEVWTKVIVCMTVDNYLSIKSSIVQIYCDYKQSFPDCTITEEQLKSHVRKEKESLKTGGADDASGKVLVQPADIMEQIRQGDRHASRNILAARSKKLLSPGASPAPKAKQDDATPGEPADKNPRASPMSSSPGATAFIPVSHALSVTSPQSSFNP